VIGILIAVALTAASWLQVIDRQTTAMLRGDEAVSSPTGARDRPDGYWLVDGAAPRPIP
jgi:hypothetical protein